MNLSVRTGRIIAASVAILVAIAAVIVIPAAMNADSVTATSKTKTIKACEKKKTGELRTRSGKKCKKGWKKIQWNQQGPAGPAGQSGGAAAVGPQGPKGETGPKGPQGQNGTNGTKGEPGHSLKVKDADGNVVGDFNRYTGSGLEVMISGGLYEYTLSGTLMPNNSDVDAAVLYRDDQCSGPTYRIANYSYSSELVGGPQRIIYRTYGSNFGESEAYKMTDNIISRSGQRYSRDLNGDCQINGSIYEVTLQEYAPVTAPPDFTGPLTVG